MKRYEGKICLITGSTAGIGLAIAVRIALEGGHVIICSRKQQNVTNAVALIEKTGGKIDGIVCDVGDAKDRNKLVEHVKTNYGKLDVLVPNAAISTYFGRQFRITEESYDALWNVNVKSTFFLIKDCLPYLRAAGQGANVCIISSVSGKHPTFAIGVYTSTKAALDNMVKWMA